MRRRRSSLALTVLLLLAVVVSSGCEFKDIDKRFFVTAIGIDTGTDDSKYQVSLKIAIPKGQLKMGEEDFITLSMNADSISDGVQKLKARSDKEFDFGHTKVLIIGNSLARRDYRDPLDWLVRQRFIQKIAWVMVGSPTAESVLNHRQKSERLPANALILAFGGQGVESQYIVSQHLYQMFGKSKDPGETPILPVAEPQETKGDTYFKIDHAALFDRQRLVMSLSPDQTKLYNILAANVEKFDMSVPIKNNVFTVHTDNLTVKKKVGDAIEVEIRMQGIVEEVLKRERVTEETLHLIEEGFAKTLETSIVTLLTKFQEQGIDPIGFGTIYRASKWEDVEKEVQEWQAMYQGLKVNVRVKCNLRSSGSIE
jgi:spore germination protein KC